MTILKIKLQKEGSESQKEVRTYNIDGCEYTASNHRMRYNPEFHEKHGEEYSTDDLIYMCQMWDSARKEDIAFALGKTHGSVLSKMYSIRKRGLVEYYLKLGEKKENDENGETNYTGNNNIPKRISKRLW